MESQPVSALPPSSRRSKEEYENCKGRLSDQSFNMSECAFGVSMTPSSQHLVLVRLQETVERYADPLAARQTSGSQNFPEGVTAEMEKKWLAAINAAKKSQ